MKHRHVRFCIFGILCQLLAFNLPGWAEVREGVPPCFHRESLPTGSPFHFSTCRQWQVEQGVPQNTIMGMTQTRDGYLWIVTFGGLARFDGVRFRTYTDHSPSFPTNRLITVFRDRRGWLWCGAEGPGLMYLDPVRDEIHVFTEPEAQALRNVNSFCEDAAGNLWICGEVLRCWDGTRFVPLPEDPRFKMQAVVAYPDGRIFIGSEQGLVVFQQGRFQLVPGLPGVPTAPLIVDHRQNLWFGNFEQGLCVIQPDGRIRRYQTVDGLPDNTVVDLLEDRDGNLWVATKNGVAICTDKGIRPLSVPGLTNTPIQSLFQDREGNFWIGTAVQGLFCLAQGKLSAIPIKAVTDPSVTAVFQDRTGAIWMSTSCNGIHRLQGGVVESLLIRCVWAMAEDKTGAIWMGLFEHGLRRYQNGEVTLHRDRDGLLDSGIASVLVAADGLTLWIGTRAGLAQRTPDGKFHGFSHLPNAPQSWVRHLLAAPDGSLWMGTDNGLFRFKDGVFTSITTANGLSNPNVRGLYLDAEKTLWAGTYGGGLYRVKNGRVTKIGTQDGLFDDIVSSVFEDRQGNFWLSGNRGLSRVNRRELEDFCEGRISRVFSTGYTKADGMSASETNGGFQNAFCRLTDGTVLYPTINGVTRLTLDQGDGKPPGTLIETISVNGVDRNALPELTFEPGVNRLEITYTGFSFAVPEKIRFQYRLEGSDSNWIQVGTRRTAFFTNLGPGTYRFSVKSCSSDGIWDEAGKTISFTIRPFFYQTRWFQALVLLVVAGAGFAVYQIRVRQLTLQAFALEKLVRERTESLRLEKEKTEKANEFKTRLLGIAAHDLKNPLFTIAGFAELTLEAFKTNAAVGACGEYVGHIKRETERVIALINSLLQMATLDSGAINLTPQPVDLLLLVGTVTGWHLPQAEAKNQKLVCQGSSAAPVNADPERITQVLDNLISNAVKYSPLGKTIEVTVSNGNGWVRVSVRDEGPGLTENDKKRLFGAFERLSARPTGGESSTGLGLSIVKQLVEAHGGKVGVESQPGQGSTFWFELKAPDNPV
ncbi:MAG: hypothetical protein K1Y36_12600 [Blastocatellia bacterium]|nr:hypothetical protein [Blastocatellia bacterium]